MKMLLPLLFLFLVGCQSMTPQPEFLDNTRGFEAVEPVDIQVARLSPSPKMHRIESEGTVYGAFDLEGMNALLEMREKAVQNTAVLVTLLMAVDAMTEERNLLVLMLKEQENLINDLIKELHTGEKSANRQYLIQRLERLTYQVGIIAARIL